MEKLQINYLDEEEDAWGQKWVISWKIGLQQNLKLYKEFVCSGYGKWQSQGTMLVSFHF